MSHSETKLLSENRKLRSQLAQKVRLPEPEVPDLKFG